MAKHVFVAMVQVETDDPALSAEAIDRLLAGGKAAGFAAMRATVLAHLPYSVTRLVAVLPVEHAQLLMLLHEAYGAELGEVPFTRPPPDYVKPG